MVQVNGMADFEDRIFGDTINLEPRAVKSVNGAFVIHLNGELLESTAHRIKRTITKYSTEGKTPVYLSLGTGDKDGKLNLITVGTVNLTMAFYREVNSMLTPYQPTYSNYINKEFLPFDVSTLIPTIKVVRTYDSEQFL